MTGARSNPLADTSVVISVSDDLRITDCLDSVDEDVEIVVVLNDSPDSVRKAVAAHPRAPRLAEFPERGNLGGAYNAGIAAASGRYLLLMDSDCRFRPGTINLMAEAIRRDPVVKGQVVYGVTDRVMSGWLARVREFDEGDYVSALSPPLLYDREIARRIGGYHFDQLIHWCEDREFDFRLQLAEIPVRHVPEAVIYHDAQQIGGGLRSYFRYGTGEGAVSGWGLVSGWAGFSGSAPAPGCGVAPGGVAHLSCWVAARRVRPVRRGRPRPG